MRADGQQSAGRFHHVARPDEMVTTQILSPWLAPQGIERLAMRAAGRGLGLMRTQNGEAGPGKIFRTGFAVLQRGVFLYGFLPAGDVAGLRLLKTFLKAGGGIPRRFVGVLAKAKREYEFSLRLW